MDTVLSFGILGVISFIIGAVKEILIIVLIFKLIKLSNIFIKEKNTRNTRGKNEDLKDNNT